MKENFQGCTAIQCSDLDIDANSVEETSPGDMTSCQAIRTFHCKNDLEYFKFQDWESEVSFHCTGRFI